MNLKNGIALGDPNEPVKYPHVPAAFINAIAEEGTKEEAVEWLQKTWNELCYVRNRLTSF